MIKENGLAVEINTSGFDRPAKEQYPSEKIIRLLYEKGIDITMGSDAHKPSEIGRYFKDTISGLKSIGFKNLVKFTGHKKESFAL